MAAWITSRPRKSDGVTSYYVRWRDGGARDGVREVETFSARDSSTNKLNAELFAARVNSAGQHWPAGWVKGVGDVAAQPDVAAVAAEPVPTFVAFAERYVDTKTDITPGTRRTYKRYARKLAEVALIDDAGEVYFPFAGPIDAITRDDIVRWRRQWRQPGDVPFSLKSHSNYHSFIADTMGDALARGLITAHPATNTGPSQTAVKQDQGEKRFLTEWEFHTARSLCPLQYDGPAFMATLALTGERFSECSATWVGDVDLDEATIDINKAWKVEGEDGEQDVPTWLRRLLKPKHIMRGVYLGPPKSIAGTRKIGIGPELVEILRPLVEGREPDDFLFTSPGGLPVHNDDFRASVWAPMIAACAEHGIVKFTRHDLRHSHVAWLIAGGVDLLAISKRLGHADFYITVKEYGHLMPQSSDHIHEALASVMSGEKVQHPKRAPIHLLQGGKASQKAARRA
jgi:integrase